MFKVLNTNFLTPLWFYNEEYTKKLHNSKMDTE